MVVLSPFSLPLHDGRPPSGFGIEEGDLDTSISSTTTACMSEVDERDTFLGEKRCIICGAEWVVVDHCNIISKSEPEIWTDLKKRRWLPVQAKRYPQHEPRNGLLMCENHQRYFHAYCFFIRFVPDRRKYVFVNYSDTPSLQQFHGKSIAIDARDRYAPFPFLFIIHEIRVRGFHPLQPTAPDLPDEIPWQDWVLAGGVYNNDLGAFNRENPLAREHDGVSTQLQQSQPVTMSAGGASSNGHSVSMNADVIAKILSATRSSPSWKACQMEGSSWTGTAEANVEKYISTIGVENPKDT